MRFLKLVHSKGSIPIDRDELPFIENALATGSILKLKQGMFNPSYFISIEEDKKRKEVYLDDMRHRPKGYLSPRLELSNIFDNSNVKKIGGKTVKRIN